MNKTKIEWCDSTLNPVVGCTFGCPYCYARRLNHRFSYVEDFTKPQFFPERLKQLYSKKPQNIFMDSMSDIADWEKEWIKEVAKAIKDNPQHNYLFLTKRPDIIYMFLNIFASLLSIPNVWLGISVTNNNDMEERIFDLTSIKRRYDFPCHLFISFEPLHAYIGSDYMHLLEYISWIIVGAETGNRKEKIVPKESWVTNFSYYSRCRIPNVPVFMKDSLIPIVGEENMLREFPKQLIHGESAKGE